jgi:TPR repeat protein
MSSTVRRLIFVCGIALALPGLPARAAGAPNCGLSVLTGAPRAASDLARLRASSAPADAYQLAQAYATGTIVAQDCKVAAQFMSTAAAAHVAAAENGLGELYRSGSGVAASDHDAAK